MSRPFNQNTISILKYLADKEYVPAKEIHLACAPKMNPKDFYNYVFRLRQQGLVEKRDNKVKIAEDGRKLLSRLAPKKDGVWKIVIFDIPEKHKYVRNVLRAKLKQLHFKKWQNSIWVTPFALDSEIEEELKSLGDKYFVRLIKAADISSVTDLEKMFK